MQSIEIKSNDGKCMFEIEVSRGRDGRSLTCGVSIVDSSGVACGIFRGDELPELADALRKSADYIDVMRQKEKTNDN